LYFKRGKNYKVSELQYSQFHWSTPNKFALFKFSPGFKIQNRPSEYMFINHIYLNKKSYEFIIYSYELRGLLFSYYALYILLLYYNDIIYCK